MITIDSNRSQAAWGKVSLDNSGAPDYKVNLINRVGETIYAHANSTVFVQLDKDYLVSGAINNDGKPNAPCQFLVDGAEIGAIDDPKYETPSFLLFKQKTENDWHKLEIKTTNNGMAHTLWRFRNVDENVKDVKVALCACAVCDHDNVSRFLGMATPNGFTETSNLFIDQQKNKLNVPKRIANLIQTAINNGAEIVVLSEVNTLIGEDFYVAAKQVYQGNGLAYYAQEIDETKVVSNDYALDNIDNNSARHLSAIALHAKDWARVNQIPNEPEPVRKLISLIADDYTKQWGTLTKLETGVFPIHNNPYVIMDNPDPIMYAVVEQKKKKQQQPKPKILPIIEH